MPSAFPDGLNISDVSPVTYVDSIMNGELTGLRRNFTVTDSIYCLVPLFDISQENQFL